MCNAYNPTLKNQSIDLDEIQDQYYALMRSYDELKSYSEGGFYFDKCSQLSHDIGILEMRKETLILERELIDKDISLSQETFKVNKNLAD